MIQPRTEQSGVLPFRFDTEGAAAYIGMSVSWLEHSDVPRVRLGRSVHFLREDLEAYMKARRSHGVAA